MQTFLSIIFVILLGTCLASCVIGALHIAQVSAGGALVIGVMVMLIDATKPTARFNGHRSRR
jgi:hypothetical protein